MDHKQDVELEISLLHQPAIDRARKLIMWAGVIYPLIPLALFAIIAQLVGPRIFATGAFALVFGIGCAICGLHIALAYWAKRSPLPATSIALGVFVAYNVFLIYHGELHSPILLAVGAFILGRGVLASYRAHRLRAQVA